MDTGIVMGWGYEGRTLDDLLVDLRAWRIDTLVDVRLNPISRKRGFSKTRLREACESIGVTYEHRRALGNPKENRAGFASPPSTDGGARARFRDEVLSAECAQHDLRFIAEQRDQGKRMLLLCFEANEGCCHRHEILAQVRELVPVDAV
jgi:uncharacterized protein (DUF488 family)